MRDFYRVGIGSLPTGSYSMHWTPSRQVFTAGREEFTHDGPVGTAPSHDLAHLWVAAATSLPWKPAGTDANIRMAEYNAVCLENIASAALMDQLDGPAKVLAHMRWFVEHHFSPFPISYAEARRRFFMGVVPTMRSILTLAPIFFEIKRMELEDPNYRQQAWKAQFRRGSMPNPSKVAPALGNLSLFLRALEVAG